MSVPRLNIGLGSFLVALALVVAVGIGSAIAVIPNNGTYYACLTKKTGAVKVINYPKVKCATGQKLIKWNAKGPVGPAGPDGAAGTQGPKGEQGSKGEQGPAGPADWNAIPNIPAGFADGKDDGGFVSEVKGSLDNPNWGVGSAFQVLFSLDKNVDVDCYLIPVTGTAAFEIVSRTARASGAAVEHSFFVNATAGGPAVVKFRCRSYSQGIAPAALKKQLKGAKVTIRKAKGVTVR